MDREGSKPKGHKQRLITNEAGKQGAQITGHSNITNIQQTYQWLQHEENRIRNLNTKTKPGNNTARMSKDNSILEGAGQQAIR